MPQIRNSLNQLQDKYLQTPYLTHTPQGSFYNEKGYTGLNMRNMVDQGLGIYYGDQMQLPQVQVQPPNAGPGGGYQWNQFNNVWQDQSRGWRPGAGGNYWGAQYGQKSPGTNARQFMQAVPAESRQQAMNYLNQIYRNR